MPSDAEQLIAIRSQALAQIADVTAQPKPSYVIDGQRVDWTEYVASLRATVEWCDHKIADQQPYEIQSWGAT